LIFKNQPVSFPAVKFSCYEHNGTDPQRLSVRKICGSKLVVFGWVMNDPAQSLREQISPVPGLPGRLEKR
jgi:hypothetical protein